KERRDVKGCAGGAEIGNHGARAEKLAIQDLTPTGAPGVPVEDPPSACREECHENQDLPNTTHPDDWARVSGKKGEQIVFIRTIVQNKDGVPRSIDQISPTGQYL